MWYTNLISQCCFQW